LYANISIWNKGHYLSTALQHIIMSAHSHTHTHTHTDTHFQLQNWTDILFKTTFKWWKYFLSPCHL